MKPEKLKSGNWRCKVYLGTDNGKKQFASVTAPTKKEAITKAAAIELEHKTANNARLTVGFCIDSYIDQKESELSPHTVQGYRSMAKIRYNSIRDIPISEFNSRNAQAFIGELSTLSTKTKKNALGLLTATLRFYERPLDTGNLKIGRKIKTNIKTPTHSQILALVNNSKGDLRLAILLGALCGLRRGEIFALRCNQIDLEKKQLTIDSAFVEANGVKEIRAPKTETSNRVVDIPDVIIKEITPFLNGDLLMPRSMNALMKQFNKLRNSLPECKGVRFHDLRHYFASVLVVAGVPDIYAMKMGGWSTPNTLKRVYQDIFGDQYEIERTKVNSQFNDIFSR